MKVWFEFPESTRYARGRNDILYTPIYFANEGIEATFRLDHEWERDYPLLQGLTAQITLTGRATLGFLSIGGRPASGFDHRYALPSVGFRPIYSLDLMEFQQTLRLDDRYYDRDDNIDNHIRDTNSIRTERTRNNGSNINDGVAENITPTNATAVNTTNTTTNNNTDANNSTPLTEQEQREAALRSQPGHRHPFSFSLPTSTLNEIQQIASSIKIITADAKSTMAFLKDTSPPLIVSVSYLLTGELFHREIRKKADTNQEIRIFVGLSEDQVPRINDEIIARNPMAALVERQIIAVGGSGKGRRFSRDSSNTTEGGGGGRRRSSIPFLRRRSSVAATTTTNLTSASIGGPGATGQESAYIIVEASVPKPFTFRQQDDAAATKLIITMTYHGGGGDDSNNNIQPPIMTGEATWMLKTVTTLTLEPVDRPGEINMEDDYFHLRAKILPTRKHKLRWDNWKKTPIGGVTNTSSTTTQQQEEEGRPQQQPPSRYTSETSIWLTQPTTATLSPSFTTPFLSHLYVLNMSLSISSSPSSSSSSKLSNPFGGGSSKQTIEMNLPVQVRYDLGFAPSYAVDDSLPEYDYSLPRYSDEILRTEGGGGVDGGGVDGGGVLPPEVGGGGVGAGGDGSGVGVGVGVGGGEGGIQEGTHEGTVVEGDENEDEDEVMAALVRRAVRIEARGNRLARTSTT